MKSIARWSIRAFVLVLCGASLVAVAPAANAAYTQPYSVVRCIELPGVNTFVQVTAAGTVSWTKESIPVGQRFNNVRILNPTLTVSSRTGCGRTAGFVTRAKAEVNQGFYSKSCGSNANLSVGFPWGISASPTYSCDTTAVGNRTTTYGQNDSWFQNNTGSPVTWSGHMFGGYSGDLYPWPCIEMRIGITIYRGTSSSDSVVWGNNEPLHALSC